MKIVAIFDTAIKRQITFKFFTRKYELMEI